MAKKEEKPVNPLFHFPSHFLITLRVIVITVCSMAVFGGAGYFLDIVTGRAPLFLIVFLIISYPVAQLTIYKVFTQKKNGK